MEKMAWKLYSADLAERAYGDNYRHAYEKMIPHTATADAPGYLSEDSKWSARFVIGTAITNKLSHLGLKFSKEDGGKRRGLATVCRKLTGEG